MLADGKFSAYSFDLHLKLQSRFPEMLLLFFVAWPIALVTASTSPSAILKDLRNSI